MKIDLPPHLEDEIVVKSLTWARDDLSATKHLIFHRNRAKDKRAINKRVKALDLIIKYYSVRA